MNETQKGSSAVAKDAEHGRSLDVISVHGVRYQVKDVARASAFYADHLGFTVEHQQLPAFASVSLGGFTLLLSGREHRDLVRCLPASPRSRVGGIAWSCA